MAVDYTYNYIDRLNPGSDPVACKILADILCNTALPMGKRFRALFALKQAGSQPAIEAIASGFNDKSALLKHEVAYVLGQMRNPHAVGLLQAVVADDAHDDMVRHEAAEALGAIADPSAVDALERARDNPCYPRAVRETCELAVELINWRRSCTPSCPACRREGEDEKGQRSCLTCCGSPYDAVDPAPGLPRQLYGVTEAADILLDRDLPLFERYRAMFTLRNYNTVQAVEYLAKGFKDPSALYRHEIAYVFGQMQNPASVAPLEAVLSDQDEVPMVRHEAAEALGSIATEECQAILRRFLDDENDVVRESCIVGLDMWDYENNDEF